MPEIQLRSADGKLYSIEETMQIGRENDSAISLNDPRVSRIHATLVVKDGFLYVRDEGSSNGTFINRIRILKSTLILDGDQLRVGDTIFAVRYLPLTEDELFLARQDTDASKIRRMTYPEVTVRDVNALPSSEPLNPAEPLNSKFTLFRGWGRVGLSMLLLLAVAAGFWLLPRWLISDHSAASLDQSQTFLGVIDYGGGSFFTPDGVQFTVPKGAFKQQTSFHSALSAGAPALPFPILPKSDLYTFQLADGEQPLIPIEISLPLSKEPLDESILDAVSAYRLDGKQWQYLGGTIVGHTLVFSTDRLGTFRIGQMQKQANQSEFRPILFINKGDTPVTLHVWRVWQPSEYKLPGGTDILGSLTFIDTHPLQVYEKDLQGRKFGYINLPYGTYKSWCLSWWDENSTLQYAVLNAERSLTLYTCRWSDYIDGRCKPETIAFNIHRQTQGVSGGCAQSAQ